MEEIRGVWIANRPHSQVLNSRVNIAQAMEFLAQMGFNVVFPVVWNQGFTLYPSEVMRSNFDDRFAIHPDYQGRNPLQEVIDEAHKRGIAVIPWFEYGFACSARLDGGHILAKATGKPHWAALDQNNALVRHGSLTWMNALDSQVQQFMLDLILEVAKNFNVDGIQGDDRLPALPSAGGYDEGTKSRFFQEFNKTPPLNTQDSQWVKWRANILTDFLTRLRQEVKAVRANLVVSMAPAVFPFCLNNLLQDSKTWVEKGLVDLISPQVYRENFESYRNEINKIKQDFAAEQLTKFAPGIAFRANQKDVTSQNILQCIDLNRNSGLQGQLLFFYEGLHEKRKDSNNKIIAEVLRDNYYAQFASLPSFFSTALA